MIAFSFFVLVLIYIGAFILIELGVPIIASIIISVLILTGVGIGLKKGGTK